MTKNSFPIFVLLILLVSCGTPRNIQQNTQTQIDSNSVKKEVELQKVNTILVTDWSKSIKDNSKIEIVIKYDSTGRKQEERISINTDVATTEKQNANKVTDSSVVKTKSDSTQVAKKEETQTTIKEKRKLSFGKVLLLCIITACTFWLFGRFKIPK